MSQKSLAVFISGQGTNLEVILESKDQFKNIIVVSSNSEAYGLERAKNHGVKFIVLGKKIDWAKLHEELITNGIELIFLAGFMRIVPEEFIKNWEGAIYNLHPSMLPHFKGLNAIQRAYEAGDEMGVSIHHVVPEVDGGEVVLQEQVMSGSEARALSLEEVTELVHEKEHDLVRKWLRKII